MPVSGNPDHNADVMMQASCQLATYLHYARALVSTASAQAKSMMPLPVGMQLGSQYSAGAMLPT